MPHAITRLGGRMLLRFHQQSIFWSIWVQEAGLCIVVNQTFNKQQAVSLKGIFALSECKLVLLCCVCTQAEVCSCSSSGDQVMMHLMQTFSVLKVLLFPDGPLNYHLDFFRLSTEFKECQCGVKLSALTYSLFSQDCGWACVSVLVPS